MKAALIVIDMQNDLSQLANLSKVLATINQSIDWHRQIGDDIIFVQHNDDWLTVGSDAWQLMPQLHREPADACINKRYPDSFFETGLDEFLHHRGIDTLTICGAQTELCVDTTIRVGFHQGFHLNVVKNGVSTVDSDNLSAAQINAHHFSIWANRFATIVEK